MALTPGCMADVEGSSNSDYRLFPVFIKLHGVGYYGVESVPHCPAVLNVASYCTLVLCHVFVTSGESMVCVNAYTDFCYISDFKISSFN